MPDEYAAQQKAKAKAKQDKERTANLRAISKMKKLGETHNWMGGEQDTLSPQENVVANQIGSALFGKGFTADTGEAGGGLTTEAQWKEIAADAKERLQSKPQTEGGTEPGTSKADEEKAKDPAASPWTQLAQSLVGQLQQEQAPMEAAISGALTQPAAATALGIADQAVGISPSSSTGQWLQTQVDKGATEMDPLQQALNAYGSAYGASNVGVDQALTNMGAANSAAISAAPDEPFLNALATRIGQGTWGYTIPSTVANGLNPAVKQALTGAGWTVDSSGSDKVANALTALPTPTAAQQNANPTTPYSGTSVTG